MKQFARQSRPFFIVSTATKRDDPPLETSGSTLREAFDGWLNSIKTEILHIETREEKAISSSERRGPITPRDSIRVNRATVRESNAHRHWPQEVVEKFLAADVITRK